MLVTILEDGASGWVGACFAPGARLERSLRGVEPQAPATLAVSRPYDPASSDSIADTSSEGLSPPS